MIKSLSPYVWLSAFLCALFFVNDWQLELFGASIVLVFGWAVISATRDAQWHVPKSWVMRIMGAFWVWAFVSVIGADISNVSLMAFCFFSALPLSFFVWSVLADEKQFKITARFLGIIFAGLAVWALLQFFAFGEYFGGRASHPLNNPNSLAALLSLGFFTSIGWMMGAKTRMQSNMALVLSIVLFGGIVCAGSRGTLFAMMPALLILGVFMRGDVVKHWRCFGILLVSCGALFFLTSFGFEQSQSLYSRMGGGELPSNQVDFTNNRMNLWLASWEIIKAHGLFGTGIGTYFLYFPEFRLSEDLFGAYYAHNDPLQYWVELGILGPVLFYAFMVAVIGRTVQAFTKALNVEQRLSILVPFCAVGACVIHTHVTFNLYNLSILFVVGFLLAVWFRATQAVLKTPLKIIQFPKSFTATSRAVAIALPFVVIGGLFSAYIISEHYTNKARDHLMAGELEEFADDVLLANKISMQGNYRAYLLAVNMPITLLQEQRKRRDQSQTEDIFNQGLSYLEHVRAINPRSSPALYYLGKIRQLAPEEIVPERMKTSEEYYLHALRLDPLHIGSRMELSTIYKRAGKNDAALSILEEGMKYKYGSSNAMNLYTRLVAFYLESGNSEGRDRVLRKMKSLTQRLKEVEDKQSKSFAQHIWGE